MQRINLHQRHKFFSSPASVIKLIVLALVFSILISVDVEAQYIDCDEGVGAGITFSPQDTIKIERTAVIPGDTVWVPIFVKTDSIMSGFQFLIAWERTKVRPLFVTDSFTVPPVDFITTRLTGRFLVTNPQGDTVTNFFSQISLNPIDSNFIICGYNLSAPGDTLLTTPSGRGVILRIGFEMFPSILEGDSALIRFYRVQPTLILPAPNPPITLDCRLSEISVDWNNSGAPVVLYPRPIDGYIVADLTPGAIINNFNGNPSTVGQPPNNSTQLDYEAEASDSVRITGPGGFLFRDVSAPFSGTASVAPTATSLYTMVAFNANGNDTATATITVTTGGGGGNPNAPVISFPDGNSFTIEQAQTVSFRVRATDVDAGQIVTLRAQSLPANAAFAQVAGTQTVEGTFSFTPDINQSGLFPVTFIATDNTNQSNSATANITVTELQFDRLFSTSADGQSPVGGLRGKRDIVFPINMVTQQTVYGVQFDMAYDANALTIDSIVVTPRTPDYVVYDDIGGSPGQIRVVTFGLANDSIVTDTNSTAILNSYWSLDSQAVPWTDYLIDLTDGWESVNPDPGFPSLEMLTDNGIIQCDNPGDVNLDKRIDVADLVNIVAYIIGNFGLPLRQFEVADIIRNDTVDVFDLVGTINTIFGIPVSPVPPPPVQGEPAVLALDYNDLYGGQTGLMRVTSELPVNVAAAEINIKYDPQVLALGAPQLGADAEGMAIQYKFDAIGNVKVLMYITNPFNISQQIPAGAGIEMIKFPMLASKIVESGNKNQLRLSKALLSTANSASITVQGFDDEPVLPEDFELFQNFPNPFNPITNIRFTIGPAEDGAMTQYTRLEIYNILGQRVTTLIDDDLPVGQYQREWNATNDGGQRVSTGVYFYRLVVGPHSQSKKMLLLK
ncbi:MAG TPA: T9SS type A sorting domain-containing protein [candidate division Zixibacteria bacterium]|nr:T9SS type A sorting domain-containing protein [candidate division Zixibacteria bacterium]